MSQKTNKIILLIALITIVSFAISIIVSKHNFKITSEIPRGEIRVHVGGPSCNAQIFYNISIPQVNLSLIDKDNPQNIVKGITNDAGSFVFSNIPSGKNYWLEIDSTQTPASYYLPYKGGITFSYGQKSVSHYIKLVMNKKALRDNQRQRSLYVYQSLLENYKKDYGHYPVSQGDEQIVNTDAHIISVLIPYLKKVNFGPEKLIDPLKDRPFIYRAGGVHYWLSAYPEIVTDIPLFDKDENAYLIHQ